MNRALKIVAWILGIFLALVIIGIVLLQIFFPVEKIKAMAVEKGSAALGRPLQIKDVDLSFWGGLGVKLDSVTVGNPAGFQGEGFMAAKNIDVKLKLLPLLTRQFRVKRLTIDKPVINMVKLADGSNNYTFSTPADTTLPPEAQNMPPEGKAAAAAVSFDKLQINDGILNYSNDSSDFSMRAENLDLSTDLENPHPGVYASSGKLHIDSLRVTSKQPVPTVTAELNYAATYDMGQKHIIIDRADFKFNEIGLDMTADFFHTAGAERGKATLKAENVSIEQVLSLLPAQSQQELKNFRVSGDFAVDMDVDYNAGRAPGALVYSGSAVFTDVALSRRDIIGELKFRRITVDAKPDNLRLNVQDGSFDGRPIKANIVVSNFQDPQVNGELSGYLDFVFLKPFLPQGGGHQLAGLARFDMKFDGPVKDYRNMNFSGDINVENGSYNAPFLPQPIEKFTLDAYFDQKLVNVREFYGKTPGAELRFQGRVENLISYVLADSVKAKEIVMNADGSINGRVDLAMLKPFLPKERQPEIAGFMNLDVAFSGSTKDLENIRPRGKVSITDASYRDSALPEPIQRFNAQMVLSPDTITVERMQVDFVTSNASFTGKLSDPFPYFLPLKTVDRSKAKRPFFQFKLTSSRFDVDKMFPEAAPGVKGASGTRSTDTLPTLLLPDVDGAGTVAMDTVIYDRIEFSNIKGKVRIENRRINVYDVTGNAYTGQIAGQTTMDLNNFNNPKYSGEFRGTNIEANDFMTRFTRFGGYLFGKINITGTYNATGWDPDAFLQSLTMNGDGSMQDGKLQLSDKLYAGLSALSDKAGLTVEKEQLLKTLKTKIRVQDGKVQLNKLTTALGNLGDAEIEGFYSFAGTLGYNGSILLTKEMSQAFIAKTGFIGNLLADQKTQRIRLPLAITGTITQPEIKFDFASLTNRAQETAKNQVQEEVKKKVGEEAGNVLKGLLGGKKKQ